jgi:hypothetical protein
MVRDIIALEKCSTGGGGGAVGLIMTCCSPVLSSGFISCNYSMVLAVFLVLL